jgi:RNA polymerase sigma-70 factor (ECF subfamily)
MIRARRGDRVLSSRPDRFEALLREHARVVSAAIRRVCGRRYGSLVPDVEQEVFLALWKRLGGGKEIEHPVSYLYKMALTTALAVVRRHAPTAETPAAVETDAGATPREFLGLASVEQGRLLAESLGRLPPDQSRAVRAYLAGFNHEEVAALYGWTASAARHRIYRGLERVRSTIAGGNP